MKTYTAAPYGRRVRLVTTEEDLARACKRAGRDTPIGLAGCVFWSGSGLVLAVLDGQRCTLVHECVHAALFILQFVGIDPTESNGEAMAYLTDHMYAHFERHISPASSPASSR